MLVELSDISKSYRQNGHVIHALDRVNLTLDSGDFLAIRGPSGGGKSTLLLILGGLLAPDSGRVQVDQQSPYALSSNDRARFRGTNIGFVFQQFHLVPYLNVLDNVLAPALAAKIPDAGERARELIAHFGLEQRVSHVPAKLSTGERQRTALARALLNRPKLLLADEPTGNLDAANADAVLKSLGDYADTGGCVLLVTHDERAAGFAKRQAHIEQGQLSLTE